MDRLVGVDPGSEVADAGIDGGLVGVAIVVTPGRRSGQTTSADKWATTVTVARGDGSGCDADVASIDDIAPLGSAGRVCHDGHGSLLQGDREAARRANVGSAPSSDDARCPSEVAVSAGCHGDVSSVSVGWDA